MEQLTLLLSTGARLLCSIRSSSTTLLPSKARHPTESEMSKGVPEWFRVLEVQRPSGTIDKYYFSIGGKKFRSIKMLKEWRENLQFETYDPDAVESDAVTF